MKIRRIILGALLALATVGLLATFAFAAPGGMRADPDVSFATMHNSTAMEQMRARMPAELQAWCNAQHAQMGQNMNGMMGDMGRSGGMMGGMGRSGGMSWGGS